MIVTARFVCQSVTKDTYGERAQMVAIWSGHPEDNSYSEATPDGRFEVYISNKAVHGHFQPGKVYNFQITEHVAAAADQAS